MQAVRRMRRELTWNEFFITAAPTTMILPLVCLLAEIILSVTGLFGWSMETTMALMQLNFELSMLAFMAAIVMVTLVVMAVRSCVYKHKVNNFIKETTTS